MTLRLALLTFVALGHLFLVAIGGLEVRLAPDDTLRARLLGLHGSLSGASTGHGYFTPDIPVQYHPVFVLKDNDGRTWTDVFEKDSNREADLRLIQIGAEIWDDPEYGWTWARAMFRRHPTATEVVVQMQKYEMPTMAAYQRGDRPRWVTVDEYSYSRNAENDSAGED
jgi:hypothetical protein